jgi:hypothetical protein
MSLGTSAKRTCQTEDFRLRFVDLDFTQADKPRVWALEVSTDGRAHLRKVLDFK